MKYFLFCFVLFFTTSAGIYYRIPKYAVGDIVSDFFNRNEIVNCVKYEELNKMFLKCWRNNRLVDVHIEIF